MENRKLIKLIPILILGFLISPFNVFAYGVETHAFLTKEAINFYNKNFSQDIPEELRNYLIDGARLEDNMPRYLNHFYDPVNNRGLDDLGFEGMASQDWVQNKDAQTAIFYRLMPQTQASLLSAAQIEAIKPTFRQTNFTWQKAVDLYAQGDTEAAFFALGHIIHLIEDMAVPDHTRNDGHPPYDDGGSPYENWTHDFTLDNPDSGLAGRLNGKKPAVFASLADYFDSMAKYSNNNFYSRDSMKNYELPEPDYFGAVGRYLYGFKKDSKDGDYKLAFYPNGDPDETVSWSFKGDPILIDKQGNLVLKDYWHRLSVKAVQHAAGVIDLFFKEAEAAKQKYLTEKSQRPYLATFIDGLRNIFGNGPTRDIADTINDLKKSSEIDLTEEIQEIENLAAETQSAALINAADLELESAPTPKPADNNSPVIAPLSAPLAVSSVGQGEATFPVCSFATGKAPARNNIIINEVAWMGSQNSFSDEWIELKNISSADMDISGWQVKDKVEQIKVTVPSGTKLSGGRFYLLERTDDNSVPGIAADGVYTGALSNTDEGLRLFDQNCNLMDEVLASPDWAAGDAATYQTMERKADLSWQTSAGAGGTPKAENSGGLAQQQGDNPPPPPPAPPAPAKVLISEIQITGATASDEFVELYNPGDQVIDLTGWSVKRKSSSGAEYALVAASRLEGKTISAKGYLLLANEEGYKGSVAPDVLWPKSNNIAADNTALLYAADGSVADKAGFGEAADFETNVFPDNPAAGQSISRVGLNDTDNNAADFFLAGPTPKNSGGGGTAAVQNFQLAYDSSNLELNFNWDPIASTTYAIWNIGSASSALVATTTANIFKIKILEIGRDYKYEVRTLNQNGVVIGSAQAGVNAPSLAGNLVFYSDPRATSSAKYLLEFGLPQYPFTNIGNRWHVIIFYYDKEAPVTDDLKWLDYSGSAPYKSWGLIAPNGLKIKYSNCYGGSYETKGASVILPDTSNQCSGIAGNYASYAINWNQLEDKHLSLEAVGDNFASATPITGQDFITAAFYEYKQGYEPNNYGIKLIALDKTKYYFGAAASHQPPAAPANLQFSFASSTSVLTVSWDKSSDPDTLDNLLSYEISYGSATLATANNFIQISAEPAAAYNFSIRAQDDFGNFSDPAAASYTIPDLPFPYKLTGVQWGHLASDASTTLRLDFSDYPFMDTSSSSAMLFFLNQNPPAGYSFLDDDYRNGGSIGGSNSVLTLSYYPCDYKGSWTSLRTVAGLILKNKDCPNKANGLAISELLPAKIDKQDVQFASNVIGEYKTGDYITLGFYQLGPADRFGNAYFTNIANYNKKIYFSEQ